MMSSEEKQKTADATVIPAEPDPTKQLSEAVEQMQGEVQNLKKQLQAMNKKNITRIALIFGVTGALSLVLSVRSGSQPLAFIGLGLIFWAALFFLVRPVTYVRGSIVSVTAVTFYATIDRIVNDLKYKGQGLYIPSYARNAQLPEQLKGLKDPIVFISKDADPSPPSIEEIASSKFMTEKPKGVCLTPPGSSLLDLFENLLDKDLSRMSLEDLTLSLPKLILDNYQLATRIDMKIKDKEIHLVTVDSVYNTLYGTKQLGSVRSLGDPLTSAVACAIAKVTGRQVVIQSISLSPDARTMEAIFNLTE
jgi:hypothetical protein